MFYLEDAKGNVVRALEWPTDKLTFILRGDTRRVEAYEDLSSLDKEGITYTVLETVDKKVFKKSPSYELSGSHLRIVKDAEQILKNIELPKDNEEKFLILLKKTAIGGGITAALMLLLSFFGPTAEEKVKDELEVVQVMNRKQVEKMVVVPPSVSKPTKRIKKPVARKTPVRRPKKSAARTKKQSGVLGVLGTLKKSRQRGGLALNHADASAGIGRGGKGGSGGVQSSIYSKGMYAAPLGSGGNVNGAGGYGTKGKGGGRAGYGKVSLVGAGDSFFQPVESDAWVEGGLSRDEIAAVIKRHLSEVRYCYEQGLQNKPGLSGRVSMRFMIGPTGRVTTARVTNSSLRHAPVENCIQSRLKTWGFPKPEGGVTVKVNYPFILRRVSDS